MVNDEDVQRIIDQGEPGVGALLEVYGPIERSYFAAVASTLPDTQYMTGTTTTTSTAAHSTEEASTD
jgi:hypothetical protein